MLLGQGPGPPAERSAVPQEQLEEYRSGCELDEGWVLVCKHADGGDRLVPVESTERIQRQQQLFGVDYKPVIRCGATARSPRVALPGSPLHGRSRGVRTPVHPGPSPPLGFCCADPQPAWPLLPCQRGNGDTRCGVIWVSFGHCAHHLPSGVWAGRSRDGQNGRGGGGWRTVGL